MKKPQLVCTFLACLLLTNVCAQTVKIIPIDFLNYTDSDLEKEIETFHGNKFRLRIDNINRKLYKIDGVKTETDFNIAVPPILSAIKAPSFLSLTVPQDIVDGISKSAPAEGISESKKWTIAVTNDFLIIAGTVNFYERAGLYHNDLAELLNNCDKKYGEIKTLLYDQTFELLNKGVAADSAKDLDEIRPILKDRLWDELKNAQAALDRLEQNVPLLEMVLKTQLLAIQTEQRGFKYDALKELKRGRLSKEDITSTQEGIKAADLQIASIDGQIERLPSQLDGELDKARQSVLEIKKFVVDGKSNVIFRSFNLVANPNNFTYLSEVITAKKDETTLKVSIVPNELTVCKRTEKVDINILSATKGGVKIDFSTNLFLNTGNEDFLGRSYYYKKVDSLNRKIISADRGIRSMLSIGALLHIYKRTTRVFKVAASAGASTTAEFTDLNFHLGPSFIFGKKDRLIISLGMTLKTSKMLDRQLKMDVSYLKADSPDEIPTVSVFPKVGAFFSIGYNISRFASAK